MGLHRMDLSVPFAYPSDNERTNRINLLEIEVISYTQNGSIFHIPFESAGTSWAGRSTLRLHIWHYMGDHIAVAIITSQHTSRTLNELFAC